MSIMNVGENVELAFKQDVSALVADRKIIVQRRRRSVRIDYSDSLAAVIDRLHEGIAVADLQRLGADLDIPPAAVEKLVESLDAIGSFQAPSRSTGLPNAYLARHARTLKYYAAYETPERDRFDYLGQLHRAKVFVLGLGGAGSWIAYQLLLAGVGTVRAADADVIEASNLNRTVLIDEGDIGKAKADVLSSKLSRLFPDAVVEFRREVAGSATDIASMASGVDLIIGAADRPLGNIRLWMAQASAALDIPSIQTGGGRVGPFHFPGKTSCAGCLQAFLERQIGVEKRSIDFTRFTMSAASLSTQPCADSSLLVLEALRYLAGNEPPSTLNHYVQKGRNLLDGDLIELAPQPDCKIDCGVWKKNHH